MFKNRKVIIFDMDGTLIDSVGIWNETDNILIQKLTNSKIVVENIQSIRDSILAKCKSSDIYLEYCNFLKEKYNSEKSAEEIHKLRRKIADELLNKIDYKENAPKLLHKLKEYGFILAIASTTTQKQIENYRTKNKNMIEKVDLDKTFKSILAKEDVKHKKPDPEVYNKTLEILKVNKKECLVFEDALIGIQAAKNAGIEVVAMYDKYSDNEREEINKLADHKFKTFKEVIEELEQEMKNTNPSVK